jgi:hypothetical protein
MLSRKGTRVRNLQQVREGRKAEPEGTLDQQGQLYVSRKRKGPDHHVSIHLSICPCVCPSSGPMQCFRPTGSGKGLFNGEQMRGPTCLNSHPLPPCIQ